MSGCNTASLANLTKCLTGVSKAAADGRVRLDRHGFAKAADTTINWLWAQMSDATAIRLGGTAFNQLLAVAGLVAIVIAVGIFVIQMAISAVAARPERDRPGRRRPGGHGPRRGRRRSRSPNCSSRAVDAISAGVLQVTTGDSMQQMGNSILAAGSISASTSNPAGLILISLLALAAVVMVWLALTVRKLLVIVAAVLSPFAFAGSLADFSRSWVRRWVELIVALVFSKLILIFVFVIGLLVLLKGVGSDRQRRRPRDHPDRLRHPDSWRLAGFAPWVAIKMAHFAGVHLEGMHMMAGHATAGATAVQSMARPVGAAVMPGGMAGAAAGMVVVERKAVVATDSRQRQAADTQGGTETLSAAGQSAPSNVGAEAASSGAATPSANGSGPSSNGSTHAPDRGDHLCSRSNRVGGRPRRIQLRAPPRPT